MLVSLFKVLFWFSLRSNQRLRPFAKMLTIGNSWILLLHQFLKIYSSGRCLKNISIGSFKWSQCLSIASGCFFPTDLETLWWTSLPGCYQQPATRALEKRRCCRRYLLSAESKRCYSATLQTMWPWLGQDQLLRSTSRSASLWTSKLGSQGKNPWGQALKSQESLEISSIFQIL